MFRLLRALAIATLTIPIFATAVLAACFGPWAPAINVESVPGTDPSVNTTALKGCPAVSPNGLRLYFASNRVAEGSQGGIDLWTATRASRHDPWGAPVNLGPAINTIDNEFCPSPTRDGKGLLFVSNRSGGCGGDDIYLTRRTSSGWKAPSNAGCTVNSAANEASPYRHRDGHGREWLYFSSSRPGGFSPEAEGAVSGDIDIYVSPIRHGAFKAPRLVGGVNSASDDARPNVSRDGRELYFDSNRVAEGSQGGFDLYSSTRGKHGWSAPANLGADVNSEANDTRAWLSPDMRTLYFGSVRGESGSQDLFLTTRSRG